MVVNLSIEAFARKFDENYAWLYSGGDQLSGYRSLVSEFDNFLAAHNEFVSEFVRYRGDYIMSDREAAAFALTLRDMTPV